MFKAIFWDNDGVLVDTEPIFFDATKTILARCGVELTEQFFIDQCLKLNTSAFNLLDPKKHNIDSLRDERDLLYMNYLKKSAPLRPGIENVLTSLHGRLKMGVVTSSWKDHFDEIMSSSGLRKYFSFFITADDVDNHKPHPEPYLKALMLTGFEPHECLVVEDTERGVTAAKAAGLTCFAVPTPLSKGNDFSKADKVLGNISELLEFV